MENPGDSPTASLLEKVVVEPWNVLECLSPTGSLPHTWTPQLVDLSQQVMQEIVARGLTYVTSIISQRPPV